MRTEAQMMDLILGTAVEDQRIRAVILNGSRANPNAPKDFFQDFDIVYVVQDLATFTCNHAWIHRFGQMMIMQMPKPERHGSFVYLMQFTDGNRIDLTLVDAGRAGEVIRRESQSVLLLDKDCVMGTYPPASDSDFVVRPPNPQAFAACCNEFWWVCPYVAKGIWRDELPYAMFMYDRYVRDQLIRMLEWHIGVKTGFSVSTGKCGKYFKRYLEPDIWDCYVRTYSDGKYENLWNAVFEAGALFRRLGAEVSAHFGFEYPQEDDARVTAHLQHVRALPRNATSMY